MKQNYFKPLSGSFTSSFFLLLFFLLGGILHTNAQVRKNFNQRTSQYSPEKKIYNINGDFTMIGNTNMTLINYGENTNNSNNLMQLVDEDKTGSTKNSSMAELTFSKENDADPACSNIIYAGLYWTGRTGSTNNKKQSVNFKAPNGSYQQITANSSNILFPGDDNMYAAYAEITDEVKAGGTGEYWVADIEVSTGNGGTTGYYGGWGMVVIYENEMMNLRDVTVFDGYAYVKGNTTTSYQIPVSGFNTAKEGPVNMKLGMMAGEGDRGISGDYFQIRNRDNSSWIDLNHSQNSSKNFFNSSINTEGSRNPNLKNNTGLDISMFSIPNSNNSVIGNNQTSARFRYGSTQDTYVIFNMVMSVDAYAPEVEGISSIMSIENNPVSQPYSALPGHEITYKIDVKNKGTEPIEDAKLVIPVPYNVEYIPNSAEKNIYFSPAPIPNKVTYDPSLGATGSLVWHIGTLPDSDNTNNILADLRLSFKVTEDCTILKNSSCGDGANISFKGSISGKGKISGTVFNNVDLIQGYTEDGFCQGQPISEALGVAIDAEDFIAENCGNTPNEREFVFCNMENGIPVSSINTAFPAGTRFYNENPVTASSTEYSVNNPFPNSSGQYYAVLPRSENCFITFNIVVNEISSVPNAKDVDYCTGEKATPLTATPSVSSYSIFYYTSENGAPQTTITPSTEEAGTFTYYVAEGESSSCISPNKTAITVTVFSKPQATAPKNIEIEGCGTAFSSSAIPVFSTQFTAITQYSFKNLGGTITSEKDIKSIQYRDQLDQNFPAVITRIFRITSECGSVDVQQVITVKDITSPEEVSLNDLTAQCAAEVEAPVTIDNCDGEISATTTNDISFTEQGTYSINWIFTDKSGNKTTAVQKVIIKDTIAPEISCTNDISETVGENGTTAVVTYDAPVASDNCEFTVEQIAGLASGSEFPLGTTTNTFIVTDAAKNTATCSFDVTITDDEDPTITCPAPINVNVNAGICGAVVEFATPEGFDNSGAVTVIQIAGPISGSVFPVGTTTVTFQVEDTSGNTATCSFDVIVTDNEAPEITSGANITQNVDVDSCSATVEYELPTATDNCEGVEVTLTEGLASGSEFPLGETTVTYTATDASGNKVTTTFTVTVVDNIAPEITCINDIFETVVSGGTTAVVTYDAPVASDNCSYTIEQTAGLASGSEFPLGTTTNTFVVTDGAGNTATCSFTVTITDDEDPSLECPAPITVNVDEGVCGAVVEFSTPEGFDNSGDVTVTQIAGPVSGSEFTVGTTTVTFRVEDASGNIATCSFDVTVNDNEAPEITSVANITQNVDVDSCSATVEYELPTATDNCEGVTVALTKGLASGSEFPLGETKVTYTATDASGNEVTTTFTVTVVDNIAPEITCTNDIFDTVEENGTTAVITYDAPVASDNCSYTVEQTTGLASGSEFPLGTTTNTFVVIDGAGNTASCSFTVTITDDEEPTITCPAPINVNVNAGICGAVVEFATPEGFDNSGDVTVTQIEGPVSGDTFPVGTTTVTFQVEDASGNTATCSFDVTVTDNEAPEITSIANITQNVDVDSCSATVEYELPTATDNCEGVTVTLTEGLASGSEFPLGETTVTYTATDASGNKMTTTFTVTVVDNIVPEITCTNDISETVVSGGTTAVVTYDAPVASDNCSYTVEQTAGLASGSEFPLGTTTNTFVVTDAAGNTATCSFDVTITDDEEPTITCPAPINVNVDEGICGAVVEFDTPEGFDNSGDVTVTQIAGPMSGSEFTIGTTTVTFQVEDASGNTATCSFDVTVNDDEAPEITSGASITQNVDVDSCSATVEYELPTATDNCEGVTVELTEGLASGETFPLGETTVTYTATDAAGNEVTTTFTVTVVDNIDPEISCTNDISETVGENGTSAVVTFDAPLAADNCSYTVEQTAGLASGSEFPLGTTTNTFVVTDAAGNTATCSFDVTITDDENPSLECPAPISVNVDAGICGAVVEFATPEGFDNSGEVTVIQIAGPVSGSEFPVGTTTVTFRVEDASGNTATCSFDVTVTDNEAPEITSVANITQNVDIDSCSATVEYELPTATDNCEGVEVTLTEGLASGSEFPLGVTEVTYTATDASGNKVTTTFSVTVVDNIDPEITCTNDISETVGENGSTAVVNYDAPVASDNCEFTVEQTAGLASGAEFPLGTTTNTFVVTDGAGNTATCSFTVTITDDEDPTITCPTPINVNVDAGVCGAVVEFSTPEGFDNSGNVTVTKIAGPESGEIFPVGTTTVTFQVEDASGNTATCSFDITITDNEAPEITSVANITQNVDIDSCSATVEYELPTATDNCEGVTVELTEGLASGSQFPLGVTEVTYTATDASGNEVTTTFTVTVVDNIAPEISCTNNIFETVGENGTTAVVTYDAPGASDNCEFTVEQTAGLASGAEFPLGTTTNTFVVTDSAGNTSTCSFDVTITDDEDPTLECPAPINVNVDAGICGAVVEFETPEGFDNSGNVTVTQIQGPASGEFFPVGTTTVTFQVEDASGNTAACSFTVTVNDNEAPEITSVANITQNVDVDSCSATVEYELPTATDNCEGVEVTLTEGLASGETFPLGETTVTYTATDASGNSVTTTFTVTVIDNIVPTVPELENVYGDCSVTLTAPTTQDGCAGEITGTTQDPLNYTQSGEYSITWIFDDGNGNISTATQKVIIEDTSAPEWSSALPSDVTVECNNVPEAATLTAKDNCGVNITFSEEMVPSDCASEYLLTRTWAATDNSGNAISHTQIISVEDNSAPILVGNLEEVINITCEEIPLAPELVFSDNCSPEVNVAFEETMTDAENGSFSITRTWTVTDCPGNEAVYIQTVNVNPASTEIETTTVDLCIEDVTFELSNLLVGEFNENGTWEDPQQTGALQNGAIEPSLLQVGLYTFDYVINDGACSSTTTVQVSINDDCIVLPCGVEDIKGSISKTVTPNGDNRNDFFTVGLDMNCGFSYDLQVFNRWGNKVYEARNYQNDWDGTSNSSVSGSNQLPAGTYYYIININQSGFEPIQSYIYLGTK